MANLTATLSFKRDAILFDIANNGYVIADVMPYDDTKKAQYVADVVEDGNVDIITRKMDMAYYAVKDLLRSWTKTIPQDNSTLDNTFSETAQYNIVLTYPDSVTMGTLEKLRTLIHEYMVSRTLFEWLLVTSREERDVWGMKYKSLEGEISQCMAARGKAIYRKVGPYF